MRNVWASMLLALVCGSSFAQSAELPPPFPPTQPSSTSGPPVPPECRGLISLVYQPPLDPLIDMLRARTDLPANTQLQLQLFYMIDPNGVPTNISIAQSSHDRDIDKAALIWGRDARFSSAPDCHELRKGLLPMNLVP